MPPLPFLSFPDADEIFTVAAADGALLPVYGLRGPAAAPVLLVGHANGLAAGSYAPWLRELAEIAPIFTFDARGHGGSQWPEGPLDEVFHVDRFADDLAAIHAALAARLGGAPLHYAGHSLNAAACLRLAGRDSSPSWASITLFEPPIFPPRDSPNFAEAHEKQAQLVSRSAARRAEWADPETLYAVLKRRGIFAGFRDDLLAAHCRATLRPRAEGGYTLCCPPAIESAIFRNHAAADTWQRLPRIGIPLALVSGDPAQPERDWVSAVMAEMAARLPQSRLTVFPGAGHLMIFEQPDAARLLLQQRLAQVKARHA